MAHEKFDDMVKYARDKEEDTNPFAPMVRMLCADCDSELVFTGLTRDGQTAIIKCGCGLAYMAHHQPANLTTDGTTVINPGKPLTAEDVRRVGEGVLPDGLIEWALEKGRLEAEIVVPRPGANLEALEEQFREWLKNNPRPQSNEMRKHSEKVWPTCHRCGAVSSPETGGHLRHTDDNKWECVDSSKCQPHG